MKKYGKWISKYDFLDIFTYEATATFTVSKYDTIFVRADMKQICWKYGQRYLTCPNKIVSEKGLESLQTLIYNVFRA